MPTHETVYSGSSEAGLRPRGLLLRLVLVEAGDAFVAGWLTDMVARPDDAAGRLASAIACAAYACLVPGTGRADPG